MFGKGILANGAADIRGILATTVAEERMTREGKRAQRVREKQRRNGGPEAEQSKKAHDISSTTCHMLCCTVKSAFVCECEE
jgi:hypothetical protein